MSLRVYLASGCALLAGAALVTLKFRQGVRQRVGGKAAPLIRLVDASKHWQGSVHVPRFVVVLSHRWTQEDMERTVRAQLPGAQLFAVRSSTMAEDSDQKAFAGHFHTELGVRFDDLPAAIQKVEQSYVLPVQDSQSYDEDDIQSVTMDSGRQGRRYAGGIIIQEFIQTRKAGVMYTNVGRGLCVINANFDLCSSVVDGEPCDQYVLQARSTTSEKPFSVVQRHVQPGKRGARFVPHADGRRGGRVEVDSERRRDEAVLDDLELAQLFALGQRLQRFAGKALDVEWGFDEQGQQLFTLQYRAMTGGANRIFPRATLYDSTNVGESYQGLVQPMTITMVQQGYEKAFRTALDLFGIPGAKLHRHKDVFANLVANVNGRVYYNMNNWHRMAAFLPGGVHRRNFDDMVTSHSATDSAPLPDQDDIRPTLWETIRFYTHFPYRMTQLDAKIQEWTVVLRGRVNQMTRTIDPTTSLCELAVMAATLREAYFQGAYAVPVNDWCVATLFGVLGQRNLREHIAFARESISARQVKMMWGLAHFLKARKDVWAQVEHGSADAETEFRRLLSEWPEGQLNVDGYLQTFGGRFANELKLEAPDLANDFVPFCQALRAYASQPEPPAFAQSRQPTTSGSGRRLSWLDRWLLRKFEFYARRREELRLLRSNTFGGIRRVLVHMGRRLHEDYKALDAPDDIFCLEMQDLQPLLDLAQRQPEPQHDQDAHWKRQCDALLDGLRSKVHATKQRYAAYAKMPTPPADFVSLDGNPIPPSVEDEDEDKALPLVEVENVLRGTGCCDGKVSGCVRVFDECALPERVDFQVMVARRTDPGWILLIGLTKAMVVEEGNLLSHAASVAREYRIPTVIGVRDACARLRTGQTVEVDGNRGTIVWQDTRQEDDPVHHG